MNSAEFEQLWKSFETARHTSTDSYENAAWWGHRLPALEPDKGHRHLERLLSRLLQRSHDYGITLFLLERLSDPAVLELICKHIQPLPDIQSADEEAHLADLIRILAASDEPSLEAPVSQYLLERTIGPHWSTVPWSLWPHSKTLFGKAWKRYFLECAETDWMGTLVVKSFLVDSAAISLVRDHLCEDSPEQWDLLRNALIQQAGSVSWLSTNDRLLLDDCLK
jgi:hypothetical protein